MKVLVVCDVLGQENNGTTIAAMNLIRYLRSKGDEVRILCADQDKKGVEDYYVVPNLYLGLLVKYLLKKNNVTLSLPVKKVILKALDGVDIVHVMIPFPLGVKTAKLARKKGIPVTAGFHCQAENFSVHLSMMNCSIVNRLVYKNYYKKLYSKVNAIHYPTEFIRNVFESTVKHKTNAYVISNGVNSIYKKQEIKERKPEYQGKFNILFIGRISKEKSHHLLIKAVAESKHKDDIQLIFAGQGPREKEVMNLAKKCKINTPLMKFFSRKDLVETINSCDLYVHPAEIEIEAISCLEAISCGLVPVINSSPRSATKAFALDEKNLFDFNDPKDLARKIDYWIEHEEEKKQRSNEYLGFVDKFDHTRCMEEMRHMLEETIANYRGNKKTYFYHDEIHDDFAGTNIKTIKIPDNYKYIHKNPFYKVGEFFINLIAIPLVYLILKVWYLQKVKNKSVLKEAKKQGYFLYMNHTNYMLDAYNPPVYAFPRRAKIIVNPDAISIKGIGTIVKMLGAIPVPTSLATFKSFKSSIKTFIDKKQVVAIYPEAHIWPYYTDIRPFGNESFHYPVDANAPSFTLTNIYVKRRFSKRPKVVSYFDGPFYPDTSLPRNERIKKLRDEIYESMKKQIESHPKYKYCEYVYVSDPNRVTKSK
ncbi:MAG: glycosyltransferase [Bacilli bacterium]|nr:glycosyltransferase [Bacilli bacterium]